MGRLRRPLGLPPGLLPTLLLACGAASSSCSAVPEMAAPAAREGVDASRVMFQVGLRSFDDQETWEPVEAEVAVGLEFSRVGGSGLGVDLGLLGSIGLDEGSTSDLDVAGAAAEIYAGLRQEFGSGALRPYVGGGGTMLVAGIDNDAGGGVADDEDTSPGYYIRAGVVAFLTERTLMALDVRYVGGTSLEFETLEGTADYAQALLQVGFRL